MFLCILAVIFIVDYVALNLFFKSFRGICITLSVIGLIICNLWRGLLFPEEEPFVTLVLNDISYIVSVLVLISADSCPSITNVIRFLGPLFFLLNTVWITLEVPSNDAVIFKLMDGYVSIQTIETAFKIQIIWFGFSYLYSVPRDPKHEYFVLLDDQIAVSELLPYRHIRSITTEYIEISERIKFRVITAFHSLSIQLNVFAAIYILNTFVDDPDIKLILIIIDSILCFGCVIFFTILIYEFFVWRMLKKLFFQFRFNMLMISVLLISYTAIQKIIWSNDSVRDVRMFIDFVAFIIIVMIMAFRDGMNITYPKYFVLGYSVAVFLICLWNISLITFYPTFDGEVYPQWFTLIGKQAYYSISIACVLSLYYLWKDPDNKYFVFIRKRKETADIWGDNTKLRKKRTSINTQMSSILLESTEL